MPPQFKIPAYLTFPPHSPGTEYTLTIPITNTSSTPLYYRIASLPHNASFFIPSYVPNAKPVKVHPGLRTAIDVKFRPVEESQHTIHDDIILELWSGAGDEAKKGTKRISLDSSMHTAPRSDIVTHRIKLRAVVPKLNVSVTPRLVEFGLCGVRDRVTQQVTLSAKSASSRLKFHWYLENESVFSIEPKTGEIGTEGVVLTVSFHPQEAMTALASAVCIINNDEANPIIFKMSGIGKYSFLTLSKNALQFGEVLVGQTVSKTFEIFNKSLVGSQFSVHRVGEDGAAPNTPSTFSFKPSSGYINAEGSATVQVTYTPHTNHSIDNETFEIRTLDINATSKRRLLCEGTALGPHVSIVGGNVMNFGDVQVGKVVHRVLELKNHSPTSVEVEIQDAHRVEVEPATAPSTASPPATFKFTAATIPPLSSLKIPVTFSLHAPINFYQRFYISIRNQNALYVDLIGNGRTETEFPAPFNMTHVYAYRERCALGLALATPEELGALLQLQQNSPNELTQDEVDMLSKFENSLVDYSRNTSDEQLMEEYFTDASSQKLGRPVSLDVSSLAFGKTSSFKLSNVYQVVRVKNHTRSKMTCRPLVAPINGGRNQSPFVVFPEEGADIQPQSYVEFRIGFRPQEENQFYQQSIDFLCSYKIQRSFRLVKQETVVPPFMLKLQVSGNTYSDPGSLAPKAFLAPNRLVTFPSLLVHEVGYQTVVLRNAGDVPLPFRVEVVSGAESSSTAVAPFGASPSEGQVEPGAFKLVTFRFKPKEERLYQGKATFYFNTTTQNKKVLGLVGYGCVPRLEYADATEAEANTLHTLLLKPTHANASSRRSLLIRNPTRIPVSYRWIIPQDAAEYLNISPPAGELAPSADFEFTAHFAPTQTGSFSTQVSCEILCDNLGPSQMSAPLEFKVLGESTKGTLTVEPADFNFGYVRVGANDPVTSKLTLLNSSDCDLPYELIFCNRDDNGDLIVEASQELFCADPAQRRGTIPARSYIFVSVEYKPRSRKYSQMAAICCLPLDAGVVAAADTTDASRTIYPIPYSLDQLEKFPSCEFEGVGSLPQLGITDIYSQNTPKTSLWHQFCINQINDTLMEVPDKLPPAAKDIAFHSYIKHLQRFLLDFGAKTIGQEDTTVHVQFENIGNIEAEFSLAFSNDTIVDVDRWAEDQGARTESQERELYIILNEIFSVTPKHAVLQPGERITVQFTYQHKLAEVHSVPLIMKVHQGGPSIVLDLTGQSLNIDQVMLHFRSLQHWFEPVQIGTRQPPIQYYELKNSSDLETRYTVDTSVLDDFSAENFGFTVLDVENPQGVLPAGGSAVLKFVFNPLEEKEYHIELPISVQNGDTYFIHFYGRGVQKVATREDARADVSKDESKRGSTAKQGSAVSQDTQHPGYIRRLPHKVPPVQTIAFPNQLARFSLDVLYFGQIPAFSVHKRLIVINNTSQTDTMRFDWRTELPQYPERGTTSRVDVEPSTGIVEPAQFTICKVTYTAGAVPEHLDCDIVCSISSETERLRKEERRLRYENEIQNIHDDTDTSPQSPPLGATQKRMRKSVVERSVRETTAKSINFISYRSSAEQLSNEYMMTRPTMRASEEDEDKYGLKPLRATEMKVRLNAHVWDIESYKDAYPDKYSQQYVPQIAEIVRDIVGDEEYNNQSPLRKQIDALGKDFLGQFLEDVLQEVLQHKSVAEASVNVGEIRTPYYAEFANLPALDEGDNEEEGRNVQGEESGSEAVSEANSQAKASEEKQNEVEEDELPAAADNDVASESSHQGSIDLPDDMLTSGGSHQSRALLDYEQEEMEDEAAKEKQYHYEMAMQQEEDDRADRAAREQDEEEVYEEEEVDSASSGVPQNILAQPDFQNLLEWILDETCVNICAELMEESGGQ